MRKFWRWITYHRHRSELRALGLAMQVPLLAALPIGVMLGFWWGLALLPIALPLTLLLESPGDFGAGSLPGKTIGFLVNAAVLVLGPVELALVAPWFFGWYVIAASLMFGRFTSARAKEKALVESIRTYCANAVSVRAIL